MADRQQTPDSVLRDDLIDLQSKTLKAIIPLVAAIGYVWLALLVRPTNSDPASVPAWLGGGLLIAGAIASATLRSHHLRIATSLLAWTTFAAVACITLAYPSLPLVYLFIVPIVSTSALLGRLAMVLMAALACLFVLLNGGVSGGAPWYPIHTAVPVGIITLITISVWLSTRNLYIALNWAWSGYQRAHENEQIARDRQAELRKALRALDEAAYRLERLNYMLALARDQAEEARRLKQQFAQTISHELRTPLNLIIGFTESMAQYPAYYGAPLPQAYLRDLSIVHRNARHLQDLVNDVLDLTRIQVAQMGLLPEEVDPVELVEAAVSTAHSLVEARGLVLNIHTEPDLPRLWLDPIRIRQVLFNLLNNAARFTDEGSVTVRTYRQDDQVIFAVTDTGIGIAPEDIPRVFEEFSQLDGSSRRRQGGVGLGLTISKHFVELHGGRIWVESRVGKGSTFYFSLPVNRQELTPNPSLSFSRAPPGEWNEDILLAVTQSPFAAGLLTRSVRGVRTVVVQSLEQARQAVQQLMPQAVLIDTASKTLNLASLGELAYLWDLDVPYMACPLPGEEPLRQRLLADGYLIKPVSRQSLWSLLRQFGEEIDSVLVVDDDRDFVRLMSRMLDDPIRRYQVRRAYNGRQALDMIQRRPPDLVLLDLMLPDIHGYQIIDRLHSSPAARRIPVVIVSAQDEIENVEAVTGSIEVTKAGSLMPGEVMEWIQSVINMATGQRRATRRWNGRGDLLNEPSHND